METPSAADSKRSYSWWWDSHISPKTSKWLQENLSGGSFVVPVTENFLSKHILSTAPWVGFLLSFLCSMALSLAVLDEKNIFFWLQTWMKKSNR